MMSRFLERVLGWLRGRPCLILDKDREGIVRDGVFHPVDWTHQVVVDRRTSLIVEKGRYRIVHRAEKPAPSEDESVGMTVIDNTRASYDTFWQSDEVVGHYEEATRRQFYGDVLSVCEKYIHGLVADVGCGSGAFLRLVASRCSHHRVCGIDFALSSLRRSRREVPEGVFLLSEIERLACRNGSFHVVICMETLEHLERPARAVRELLRVCRDGGYVILTIPNGAHDHYVGHLNFWSEADFRALLGPVCVTEMRYLQDDRAMVFVVKKDS